MFFNKSRTIICLFALITTFSVDFIGHRPLHAAAPASADDRTTEPLRIIATIRPLKLILAEALGDELAELVDLSVLMAPEVSPHGFEPTPSQMARLRRADVILYNGLGLDDWAVRGATGRQRTIGFVEVADIDAHDHHHHDHDHHDCDHHHGPVDEHFWLDVELVGAYAARCIGELIALGRADQRFTDEQIEKLHERLIDFSRAVGKIDDQARQRLEPFAGRRIVTHHNVFSRITERYGLGEPVVLRPLAVVEPTPRDLRTAIDTIRRENIPAIFIEPQFSSAAAERIRDETNVKLIEVDPLGSRSETWSSFMESILDAIEQGFRAD
ncbi:MAG: zinc ABC transporter substrate-binding protein [Phycisphaerales bacterium]|nr:MAG: zinc ABC transporter substrate-binding protein [Phycisphaerales bacterium]